jgi:hypothetical protein
VRRRPLDVLTVADIETAIAPARATLGEAAWAAAFAAGWALTLEEAIAEALAVMNEPHRKVSQPRQRRATMRRVRELDAP